MGKLKTTYNFRHNQSVRFEENNGYVYEYDRYDRNTFYLTPKGYWCLNFFEEPKEGRALNVKPYQSVHKYWEHYNKLKK